MNLRTVDLNLLLALDALLDERHVTRAAARIGLSQPAMSNALGRLRQFFDDDLLIRTAGGMRLTRRAIALQEPVRQALRQLQRVFMRDAAFDPATATQRLVLRMSDLLCHLLLPSLIARIDAAAPGIGLDVVHLPPERTVDALELDEVHLAVSTGLEHPGSIRAERLFDDRMVCVMRTGHALSDGRLTLRRFLAERHLKVSMSPTDARFVDDVLAARERRRKVALNLPHWLIVPDVVRRTDLVAVMPERLARTICDADLVARAVPFAARPYSWSLYSHRRHDGSPAVAWLRDQIRAVCAEQTP